MADNRDDHDDQLGDLKVTLGRVLERTEAFSGTLDRVLEAVAKSAEATAEGFKGIDDRLAAHEKRLAEVERAVSVAKSAMSVGLRKVVPAVLAIIAAGVGGAGVASAAPKALEVMTDIVADVPSE